ncbi:MAG TPA: glutaredoxin 3 [Gammaproteobacteria bacterium]|nr:glutaredoxin 3 [Gammaproteobacteria bacterium]HDZ78548.1 glutaredoxin 3 [Gammaproteobacteria bacterium]
MAKVRMYCTRFCPYCIMAIRLLTKKGQEIEKIFVDDDPSLRDHMIEESQGRTTVPQIFIDEAHIGGYTDMVQLDHNDALDSLLTAEAAI